MVLVARRVGREEEPGGQTVVNPLQSGFFVVNCKEIVC